MRANLTIGHRFASRYSRAFSASWARSISFRHLIHHEGPECIASSRDHVLMTIEHVGLRRIGDVANARVPERLAICRIVSDQVSGTIAGKDQSTGGCQHTATPAAVAVIRMPPGDLSC